LHVTLEEGTCAAWLHDLLKPHVTQVLVCDPRKNALIKAGNKSDRIDARKLADLLYLKQLNPVYHGETGNRALKELGAQLPGIDPRYHTGDEPLKSPV
jgi:transposase